MTTPAKKVREFRAAYIQLGTISAAARKVKLPITTCWELAQRAESDPAFVEKRKAIDARHMAVVQDLVIASAEDIAARIAAPDLSPKQLAAIAVDHGLKSFSYQNPKPAYFRGLVEAHKAISARARLDAEREGTIRPAGEVTIRVSGPGGSSDVGEAGD